MIINGKSYNYDSLSINELLDRLSLDKSTVVVEVNAEIIDQSIYDERILFQKDTIEIVAFVGGG